MAGLKSLAKDTAIYGLSSIVGRFLNYMLVPLYTAVLPASTGGYGVVSNVYAFTAAFPRNGKRITPRQTAFSQLSGAK